MRHSWMSMKKTSREASHLVESLFPSQENWKPPARELLPDEKELLLGPSKSVSMLKRLQMRAMTTGRWITYSASKYEQSSRVSSSYVSLNLVENRIGQITRIFSHTFARCETIFVEISLIHLCWTMTQACGPFRCPHEQLP